MKNLMLITTLFFTFLLTASAQNSTVSLGYDIVGFYGGEEDQLSDGGVSLALESALGKRFTVEAKGSYLRDNLLESGNAKLQKNIKNLSTGINFYPKAAHRGFFLGVDLGYTKVDYKLKAGDESTILRPSQALIGAGLNLGFKTNLTNRLSFKTAMGTKLMTDTDFYEEVLQVSIGASIGYKF